MFILIPIDIASVEATNIPLSDYPEWTSAASFEEGDYTQFGNTIYRALVDNVNKSPAQNHNTHWRAMGASNAYRPFDKYLSGPAAHANLIEYKIRPAALFRAIGLFNLAARAVEVIMHDDIDGEVFRETKWLEDDNIVTDYYDYFFREPIFSDQCLFSDLPAYPEAEITLRITGDGAQVEVGQIVIGPETEIGRTESGVRLGLNDYSLKARNDWGQVDIVERDFSNNADFTVWVPSKQLNQKRKLLHSRRAKPTVYYVSNRSLEFGGMLYATLVAETTMLATGEKTAISLEVETLV